MAYLVRLFRDGLIFNNVVHPGACTSNHNHNSLAPKQLVAQAFLIILKPSIKRRHCAMLHQPQLVYSVFDQVLVVTHQQHPPLEHIEAMNKRVYCLNVQVIGRLIQQQKVGLVPCDLGGRGDACGGGRLATRVEHTCIVHNSSCTIPHTPWQMPPCSFAHRSGCTWPAVPCPRSHQRSLNVTCSGEQHVGQITSDVVSLRHVCPMQETISILYNSSIYTSLYFIT